MFFREAQLVILDEPTSGLDPTARLAILRLVKDLARNKGLGVILATHLLADVEAVCEQAPLVLLGSDLASRVPAQQLDELLSRVQPAVVVVPDIRGRAGLPDLAHRLRKQLGVLE